MERGQNPISKLLFSRVFPPVLQCEVVAVSEHLEAAVGGQGGQKCVVVVILWPRPQTANRQLLPSLDPATTTTTQ